MSDLVERLRRSQANGNILSGNAADEIERLRAALERIANWEPHSDGKLEWYDAEEMQKIAREALRDD